MKIYVASFVFSAASFSWISFLVKHQGSFGEVVVVVGGDILNTSFLTLNLSTSFLAYESLRMRFRRLQRSLSW